MSQFAQSEEHVLLQDNLRRFLQQENEFERRRERLDADKPERMALWPGLAELGVLGAAFSEEQGGFGGDSRTIAVVMQELGRALAVEPYQACAVMAGRIIQNLKDAEQRQNWIAQIISGECICIVAHDAGFDPWSTPKLRLTSDQSSRVTGRVRHVRHADVASEFLLSVETDNELALFRLPANTPGLSVDAYRLMDGAGAGHLRLDDVCLDPANQLHFSCSAADALHQALNWGVLAQVSETRGILAALNHDTFEYLSTRKQFGQLLSNFQALQHRCADMYIAEEELATMADVAITGLQLLQGDALQHILSSAKIVANRSGRLVGHEAIQMHGGMGVSEELNICHFGRRLSTMRAELGSADIHRLRALTASEHLADTGFELPESAADQAWRGEIREFVKQHLPEHIAKKGALGLKIEKEDYVCWQKILREHGWFAAAWPQEDGGKGWNLKQQLSFLQESAVCNGPMISPYGVNMVGPVISRFGTEQQKRQHIPGILSSDVWWCQGYSESGAGSDLASLKTAAVREGDHYIVNGAKMWTTEAHWADWMHCLVRTSNQERPQKGISFLLIDMQTPGIEIKPIVTIDGIHHTNALFFNNVKVPIENLVGEEGQGWSIAKFLLGKERVSIADTGPKLRLLKHIRQLWSACKGSDDVPDSIKAQLGNQLAQLSTELISLCAMERRYIETWNAGTQQGPEASILKIRGTEILQGLSELAMAMEGPLAAAHNPEDLHRSPFDTFSDVQKASLFGHEYLYGRCWSIFGGTNEVQRNIIAGQLLATR